MLVKLTVKGCAALGKNKEQAICNVSDRRAFALMDGGFANPDHGFMSRFAADNPKPERIEAEQAVETELNVGVGENPGVDVAEGKLNPEAGDGLNQGVASEGGAVVGQKKK